VEALSPLTAKLVLPGPLIEMFEATLMYPEVSVMTEQGVLNANLMVSPACAPATVALSEPMPVLLQFVTVTTEASAG
jgi:hypothetical protein